MDSGGSSCRDVRVLLAERCIDVDASTIHRWVRKFVPEVVRGSFKHRSWRGQLVDFRLTIAGSRYEVSMRGARRDTKAARAFLKQACENARLYQPRSITTDKAHSNARVIGKMNLFELPGPGILPISRKWKNNRIESGHASLRKLITPTRGFNSLSSAKATLRGIEAIRTIKHGHVHGKEPGVTGEIRFVERLFELAA